MFSITLQFFHTSIPGRQSTIFHNNQDYYICIQYHLMFRKTDVSESESESDLKGLSGDIATFFEVKQICFSIHNNQTVKVKC